MKRMIGMVAAMALVTSTAAFAQNVPEIHQYFTVANAAGFAGPGTGGLTTSAADRGVNPAISAPLGNSTVFLAVWIRAVQGNATGPVAVTGYNYEIGRSGTGLAHFVAGGDRQRDLGGSYVPTQPLPSPGDNGNTTDGTGTTTFTTNLFGLSGANSGAAGAAEINSNASGDSAGAFLIRVIQINIVGGVAGDTLNLYMNTPRTGGALYTNSAGSGTLNTVAYGATGAGAMDAARISNTTQLINGLQNDRISAVADAVITIVPEPGTIGLIALGLLGLRRRRN